ncbi:MAG: Ig-like domain-containing protein, partial [Nocardioides sp.]
TPFTTKATSLVVPTNQVADTYYWQVQAIRGTGVVTDWSATASYTVLPIAVPTVTAPATGQDVEDVVLHWDPVPGAKWYELQVDDDSDFQTPVTGGIPQKVFGTTYSPKITFPNDQYFWRVRAVDLANQVTAWQPVATPEDYPSFNRIWRDTPQAIYPAGPGTQQVGDDLYFQWTPVQHASNYELWFSTDENFTEPTTITVQCIVAGTTYTPGELRDDCMPTTEGTRYYWKVRPMDRPYTSGGVQGIFSETQSFVYRDSQGFTGVTPVSGSTVDVPTLSWNPVPNTETYNIRILSGTGASVLTESTFSTSYTPLGKLLVPGDGPYTWSVQAEDVDGRVTTAAVRTFQVSGAVLPATGPGLTPITGIASDPGTLRFPKLSWQPVTGADHYRVHIGDWETDTWSGATKPKILSEELKYPSGTDDTEQFLGTGEYDWYVTAHDDSGMVIADGRLLGRYGTFRITPIPPVTGQRIALTGQALDNGDACAETLQDGPSHICLGVTNTPVLDWDKVEGISFYKIHLSYDQDFTTGALDKTPPATTNTRWTPNFTYPKWALSDSVANQAYHWFIQPCKTETKCGPDPTSTVAPAKNAFRKDSPSVVPVAPLNGTIVQGAEVSFSWQDYFDTNQATTWAATGETGTESAATYRVQVDTDNTFGTPIDDVVVDQATYTPYDRLYPEGPLYWRVQALDVAGNGLGWSEPLGRVVNKQSPSPTLTSPISNSHVSGSTPFEWQAQAFTGKYQLQVAKNDDANFSGTNVVFTRDTTQPAFTSGSVVKGLPASSSAYRWRVRRVDPDGNPGPWSQVGRFFSEGAVPTQLAPGTGSYQAPNGPLFQWTSVGGAATYKVTWKRDGGSTGSATTAATGFAPTTRLSDGSYTWQVTALDTEGAALGSSASRTFRVDATAPRVTTYTPRSSARRTSSVTATFSEPVRGVSGSTVRLYLGKSKVKAKVTYSSSKRRATLNPSGSLKKGRTYTMKISGPIKDAKGNSVVAKTWKIRIS